MILFWHQLKNGETSRGLLDKALLAYAEHLGRRKPRKARRSVAEGAHGKPYLPEMPHVFFSVSHSGSLWICLLDKSPVGVDCELPSATAAEGSKVAGGRPFDRLATRYFAPEEQRLLAELGGGEEAFLQIWTRKEAYIKYTGRGLSQGLASFSVAAPSGQEGGHAFSFAERLPAAEEAWTEALQAAELQARKTGRKPAVAKADLTPVTLQSLELPVTGAITACCGPAKEVTVLPLPEPAEEEQLEEAKELALEFLTVKERTEGEVRKKLREKEFDSETIERVLEFLREYSYVNDEDFAKRYVRWGAAKGRGPLRLERDLAEKGISREWIRQALSEFRQEEEEDPFLEAALAEGRRILENAGHADASDEKLQAKILRRLASKGYSASVAYKAVNVLRKGAE